MRLRLRGDFSWRGVEACPDPRGRAVPAAARGRGMGRVARRLRGPDRPGLPTLTYR